MTNLDYHLRRFVAATGIIKLLTALILGLAWLVSIGPKKKGRR